MTVRTVSVVAGWKFGSLVEALTYEAGGHLSLQTGHPALTGQGSDRFRTALRPSFPQILPPLAATTYVIVCMYRKNDRKSTRISGCRL